MKQAQKSNINPIQELNKRMLTSKSRIVVGLDPDVSIFPAEVKEAYEEAQKSNDQVQINHLLFNYCTSVIDAVHDLVPAVKPNIAFFEQVQATQAFYDICRYAKGKGLMVIADVKRGDIGNTASAYARGLFAEGTGIDLVTLSDYMGKDSIRPFLPHEENGAMLYGDKGVFVLSLTSNESAKDLQTLKLENGRHVYEEVAYQMSQFGKEFDPNGYMRIGLVVGATKPEQGKALRMDNPDAFFLVPGVGKQGGGVKDAALMFDIQGGGAIVNVSRGILEAGKNRGDMDFEEAIRKATKNWVYDLNVAVDEHSKQLQVIEDLFATKAINASTGAPFMYTSGKLGPYFVNSEFLLGSKETSKEVLTEIDRLLLNGKLLSEREKEDLTSEVLSISRGLYNANTIYRNTIDCMISKVENDIGLDKIDYISGGERRDWIFSLLVAEKLDIPHVALFKSDIIRDEQGNVIELARLPYIEDGAKTLEDKNVLHIADLINTASSYRDAWRPQIDFLGGKINDTLVVNVRVDDGGEDVLDGLGIKTHCLVRVDEDLFKYALSQGIINDSQFELIKEYTIDPADSMNEYIAEHPEAIHALVEQAKVDKKVQDKMLKCWGKAYYPAFNENAEVGTMIDPQAGKKHDITSTPKSENSAESHADGIVAEIAKRKGGTYKGSVSQDVAKRNSTSANLKPGSNYEEKDCLEPK